MKKNNPKLINKLKKIKNVPWFTCGTFPTISRDVLLIKDITSFLGHEGFIDFEFSFRVRANTKEDAARKIVKYLTGKA